MQWLLTLEMEKDLITICRLMNILRRKGLKIATLAMAARAAGFSLMAVVDSPEGDVDHIFNFLRRTEGVEHVTYYRHETSRDASFIFVDDDADNSRVTQILAAFPGSQLIFASHGKYLLEIPAESRHQSVARAINAPGFLPFARVKTTRDVARPELVGAQA